MPKILYLNIGRGPSLNAFDLVCAAGQPSLKNAVCRLQIRDLSPPSPTARSVRLEHLHASSMAYVDNNLSDSLYLLHGCTAVQGASQVSL